MSSSSYLIKSTSRCLVTHAADENHHGFLVGTANLRGPNEVREPTGPRSHRRRTRAIAHGTDRSPRPRPGCTPPAPRTPPTTPSQIRLLRYFEDDEAIECTAVYAHKHEVVGLAACPYDAALVATVFNEAPRTRAAVWRMPDIPGLSDGDNDAPASADNADLSSAAPRDLTPVAELPSPGNVQHVQWRPTRDGANAASLLAVEAASVRVWTLRDGGGGAAAALGDAGRELPTGDASFVGGAAWDPHHPHEVAVAADAGVQCWDLRSGARARGIDGAVPPGCVVRDLSYNPNKPWHLATAGDDYRAKVWDLRKPARPVKILDGHTHWWVGARARGAHGAGERGRCARALAKPSSDGPPHSGRRLLSGDCRAPPRPPRSRAQRPSQPPRLASQGDACRVQPLPRPAHAVGRQRRARRLVVRARAADAVHRGMAASRPLTRGGRSERARRALLRVQLAAALHARGGGGSDARA